METKIKRPFRRVTQAEAERRARKSESVRVDRIAEDMEGMIAALEIQHSLGNPKEIASAAEVDQSTAWRWVNGEPQNLFNRLRKIVTKAKRPFGIITYFLALVIRDRLLLTPMPEWRWRSLYKDACRQEQAHDCHEDIVTVELLTGGDATIRSQYEADARVVAATLHRMALGQIGLVRGYTLTERAH